MKLAFMFSGQGAQALGMGKTLAEEFPTYKKHLEQASNIMGEDLTEVMFDDENRLNQTLYAQPAIFSMQTGIIELLKTFDIISEGVCGLSLGEYAAYYDAGVFNFEDGMRIIIHRAYFMHQATLDQQTKMAALLGDYSAVETLLAQFKDCYVANLNLPNQTVVGGPETSITQLIEAAKDTGIKRAVLLGTSGAFHTPYMDSAQSNYHMYLQPTILKTPEKELFLNTIGNRFTDGDLKSHMINQITASVRFYEMIQAMIDQGYDTFIEIGPGKTLSGLVKKLDRTVSVFNIETTESLHTTIKQLKEMK